MYASSGPDPAGQSRQSRPPESATVAAFAPSALGRPSVARPTIVIDQKSPLLVATPPAVIRALSYVYPFVAAANTVAGLISWTSGDGYASFLVVAGFWSIVLYSDIAVRYAGPVIVVIGLIVGMYLRRYSPLSTRTTVQSVDRSHRSFEDIIAAIELLTARLNILLDPFISLTDFLSTQRTATTASTRPALTTLLVRILVILPIWIGLAHPSVAVITTRRLVLVVGTIALSWHSRPARISRILLWRSRLVRWICVLVTGLHFTGPGGTGPTAPAGPTIKSATGSEVGSSIKPGVTFTFSVYENQRRWLGFGWTSTTFPFERDSWTNEHLGSVPPKDLYRLPEVANVINSGSVAHWEWAEPDWRIDTSNPAGRHWTYYDNKWLNPTSTDSWNRYTRRRKWCRNARLVEGPGPADEGGAGDDRSVASSASHHGPDWKSERGHEFERFRTGLYSPGSSAPCVEPTACDYDQMSLS